MSSVNLCASSLVHTPWYHQPVSLVSHNMAKNVNPDLNSSQCVCILCISLNTDFSVSAPYILQVFKELTGFCHSYIHIRRTDTSNDLAVLLSGIPCSLISYYQNTQTLSFRGNSFNNTPSHSFISHGAVFLNRLQISFFSLFFQFCILWHLHYVILVWLLCLSGQWSRRQIEMCDREWTPPLQLLFCIQTLQHHTLLLGDTAWRIHNGGTARTTLSTLLPALQPASKLVPWELFS